MDFGLHPFPVPCVPRSGSSGEEGHPPPASSPLPPPHAHFRTYPPPRAGGQQAASPGASAWSSECPATSSERWETQTSFCLNCPHFPDPGALEKYSTGMEYPSWHVMGLLCPEPLPPTFREVRVWRRKPSWALPLPRTPSILEGAEQMIRRDCNRLGPYSLLR